MIASLITATVLSGGGYLRGSGPPATTVRMLGVTQPLTSPSQQISSHIRRAACAYGSHIDPGRVDAVRCTAGSFEGDPCFTAPAKIDFTTSVLCPASPWNGSVAIGRTRMTNDTLKAKERLLKQRPHSLGDLERNSPPWAVHLANGTYCVRGSDGELVAGLIVDYLCYDSIPVRRPGGIVGAIVGDVDRRTDVWHATYVPQHAKTLSTTEVRAAFY